MVVYFLEKFSKMFHSQKHAIQNLLLVTVLFYIIPQKILTNIKLEPWTKLLRQNRKSIFEQKNPLSMLFAKFWAFYNKTWPDSTLI